MKSLKLKLLLTAIACITVLVTISGYVDSALPPKKKISRQKTETFHNQPIEFKTTLESGSDVEISSTDKPGIVKISIGGESTEFVLPDPTGKITELTACQWMNLGVAVAVECETPQGERDYSWFICNFQKKEVKTLLGTSWSMKFHTSPIDYDLTSIRNSSGDSIYITLIKHSREINRDGFLGDDSITGLIYIHNCPSAAQALGPGGGMMYTIKTKAVQQTQNRQ